MTTLASIHKRGFIRWTQAVLACVIILVTAIWGAGAAAKTNLIKRYPAPGQLVDVGGYQLHIHCIGQGSPPVILSAGLDDFSVSWSLVQPQVGKFARVCSYDRGGLGWSEPSPDPRTGENIVRELHTLLVNAKVEKPYVLVGHSFGGALVQLYAHNYPDEVTGMVLVDATHDELFKRIPAWRKPTEQMLALERVLAPLSSSGILALAPESIPNRGLPGEALAQYRAIALTTRFFETAVAERESFERNLAEVRARRIASFGNMPLVVVSEGAWDSLPGLSDGENQQAWQAWQTMQSELTALSSNGKQVIAGQSGHFVQLQQPDLVIDAIREIVQEHRK